MQHEIGSSLGSWTGYAAHGFARNAGGPSLPARCILPIVRRRAKAVPTERVRLDAPTKAPTASVEKQLATRGIKLTAAEKRRYGGQSLAEIRAIKEAQND